MDLTNICPRCDEEYDKRGGHTGIITGQFGREAPLCRVCSLELQVDSYQRELNAEDREWALRPEDKVLLTLTGANLEALVLALGRLTRDDDAEPGIVSKETWRRDWLALKSWLGAVLAKGPADAGGCLADHE